MQRFALTQHCRQRGGNDFADWVMVVIAAKPNQPQVVF